MHHNVLNVDLVTLIVSFYVDFGSTGRRQRMYLGVATVALILGMIFSPVSACACKYDPSLRNVKLYEDLGV